MKSALPKLYNMRETAEALHLSPMAIKNFRRQGRIKPVQIGRKYFLTEDTLIRIIEKGLPPTTAAYRTKTRLDMRARRKAKKVAESSSLKAAAK